MVNVKMPERIKSKFSRYIGIDYSVTCRAGNRVVRSGYF
jgi:hypothetical protein